MSAQRGIYPDESEVMGDWQAVLSATKHHLHWLRGQLRTKPRGEPAPAERSDNALGRLAQAIGAGADVLAVQDAAAAAALEVSDDLIAARAEVAAIALMAARVVVRNPRPRIPGRSHLRRVMQELAQIAEADVRRCGLGGLADLAAGGPAALDDGLSMVPVAAARWERAHASVRPETVLTRDLRSTTAQLRTVGGSLWHVASQLLSSPSAGLDPDQRCGLGELRSVLRDFESSAGGVERAWRRRLSDLSGLSESPGEAAYLDLMRAVDGVLRDDRGLRAPHGLVPDRRAAVRLIDAVDEVLWSAEQVCRHQLDTVRWLIGAGRLFVPRHEAVHADIYYLRRPTGGSRPLQAKWVLTHNAGCFDELAADLDESADRLKAASRVARGLAGTSALSRRTAETVARIPQRCVGDSYRIEDPGQEFADLVR
ncbi:hypothetical protein JOF29_002820 [Kribbella aluminosa]|uniref:DUF2786 domain-containing protein n=1 Tax=Kribbella aluminosa TaxID=416017 RepID=A0ABS4UJA4_9ACTN|nr:hypothetical protein [Kribbella aluminosa]MBP2351737.1 hypothetical protein [Kribbella aluminosa]